MTAATEKKLNEFLASALSEGVHAWGFTADGMTGETGQFGNFDPDLHFENSIKALSVTEHQLQRVKEQLGKSRRAEN